MDEYPNSGNRITDRVSSAIYHQNIITTVQSRHIGVLTPTLVPHVTPKDVLGEHFDRRVGRRKQITVFPFHLYYTQGKPYVYPRLLLLL